jgi:hypothetical protein
MSKTKLFLDVECTGLVQNTTLISLGIVSECGKTFYAEFNDYNKNQADSWIQENVIDNLKFSAPPEGEFEHLVATRSACNPLGQSFNKGYSIELRGTTEDITKYLKAWLNQFKEIEIWSDCLAYDWVLFCELFGGAMFIPKNIYYIPMDICTAFKMQDIDPDIDRASISGKKTLVKHNALDDARMIKDGYYYAMNQAHVVN